MSGLKPFFCFYGGKWRAAPKYPAPKYNTIVEPFAGAAGYSTRYADRRVVLLEKDPVIAALWKFLVRSTPAEILSIPTLEAGQTVDDLDVCPEAKSLVGFWLSKGSAQPKRSPSTWMKAGTHDTSFWGEKIRARIAGQVDAIKHWRVVEGSYADFEEYVEGTWFIDPPYERQGSHYRCSSKEIDFQHLAAWSQTCPGQVIVCEQEGATWLPFEYFGTFKANESKHGKAKCAEVIWTSDSTSSTSVPVEGAISSTGPR